MDIAGLQPRYFLGLRTDIKGNVQHVTEEDILYPIGGVLVLHNFAEKRQKYIRLPEKGYNVQSVCVSPNKKVIAIAETGETPVISIYDASTLKRKRQIMAPVDRGITTRTIECMSFTTDSKSLLVIYGEPDWMLFSYKYDRAKIESSTRANNMNNTGIVRQIACNPNDATVVVIIGDILFRMLAVTESIWRQYGYSKSEQLYFRSVAWLSQERLIAGTADGRLLMIENGELKALFRVEECTYLNMQMRDDIQQTSATALLSVTSSIATFDNEVHCIVPFSKGFVVECGVGKVHFFEKETPHRFKRRNIFRLEDETRSDEKREEPANKINYMSVSPTQDYLVVTSGLPQLYHVYLWGPDISRMPEVKFQQLGSSLHRGSIQNIAVCAWKPLLITVGREDRTIRVWNYETMDQILSKSYQEDVYGVTLHPTGLYALVGFSGKLRFLTLLIDDFAVSREFAIRYCSVCRFSSKGHLFAAVNGNVIQVYSSISFENEINLKGHNGRVTALSWIANDYRMVSCGTEGTIYEWEMATGKRLVEVIVKTCSFTGIHIATDGKVSYAVGSDGEIKEVTNAIVRTEHHVDSGGIDCLVLANSDMMLFVSGKNGTVYSVKLPLTDKQEHMEFNMHNTVVTQLKISYDDKYLISCSMDGSLCIWKLVNVLAKGVKVDKDFQPSVDILIPYKDLEEKIQSIRDLNLRMTELDTEHAYQVRQIEARHMAKLTEVHEAYKEAIEELKDKNSVMEAEHIQEIHTINMEIGTMKRNHDMAIENLEATYNEKLINEYGKYGVLEEKLVNVRKDYEGQLEGLADAKKKSEDDITQDFLQQLHDKDVIIQELKDEMQRQQKDHEVIKQQIEDDADREIFEMKTSHEEELKDERSVNIDLRAENGIFRKKLNASQKETEELKHTIFTLESEHVKFKNVIVGLEKDILELKKEITERDETIQEKEKRIYDLKKKTQELEKYKFVLEFKIDALKSQIEPRERKIHDQKEQIDDMILELENLQKNITSLELQLGELREKLGASHNEYRREQIKFRQACELIKSMRTDLHHVSGLIQEPNKLKIALKDMYHKYNADKEFVITREEDCDARNEFLKQRHYLEKTVTGLKKTVSKRFDKNADKLKIMEESTQLISETNVLRNQLKLAQRRNRQMESILGISKKCMQPREAQKRLAEAVRTREDIRKEYQDLLEVNEVNIEELQGENSRLAQKLNTDKTVDFTV